MLALCRRRAPRDDDRTPSAAACRPATILARTRGSAGWAAFYGVFVVAVAVHAPIGLRVVAGEWAGLRGRGVDVALAAFGLALLGLGARAVYAVTVAP